MLDGISSGFIVLFDDGSGFKASQSLVQIILAHFVPRKPKTIENIKIP